MARIRGDLAEGRLLAHAQDLVHALQIESDGNLGPLFLNPPPDTDPELLRRMRQLYDAGAWVLVESAIADLPADLRWLYEAGTLTLEQLTILYERLDVASLADLIDAVHTHAVPSIPGLDEAVERAIEAALPTLRRAIPRIPLGRAVTLVEPILEQIRSAPGVAWAHLAGSARRAQDTVGDLEIVAAADHPGDAMEAVAHDESVDRILHRSARRLYLLTNRVQVGVRFPAVADAGSVLLYLTGSTAHFRALQERAAERGWTLTRNGLRASDGTLRMASTEEEIYAALELPLIPAEIRNGEAEIAVAAAGRLPELLSRDHIRGDLHMHSTWSDGRDSIGLMVGTCRQLGYEYVAMTDHSPRSGAVRTLTAHTVGAQAEEIAALRERMPDITILHGCEVDILPDGRLDFPDKVLEQFDIVLASLHHRADQSRDELLRRYIEAMRHPLVTIITHPANRMIPNNPGYDLDYDRLFEAAVETGTCLEIDGAPGHLDMDSALARRAVAAGVSVTVDSDAHRTDALARQMGLGVATACRGWVEPRHVLNTRPLADVRAVIKRKRDG
ncbi:MAG: PHP domain-containing protein [Acidobacteriota bacterium]